MMKQKALHITAITLLMAFTFTVVGININYHICGETGATKVAIDTGITQINGEDACGDSCGLVSNNEDTSCCKESHSNAPTHSITHKKHCSDQSELVAINSDFVFSLKNDGKSVKAPQKIDKEYSELNVLEKVELESKVFIKKLSKLPRKLIILLIRQISHENDAEAFHIL